MKKRNVSATRKDLPVFDLDAFHQKASWSDFYIQKLRDHVNEHAFIQKPHKHDFYLILFVEEGTGTHTIDFVMYPVRPKSLFLMTPGQIHTWALSEDATGFVVFFTRAFYEMQLSKNSLLEFPFYDSLVASPAIQTDDDEPIRFALNHMFIEYASADAPNLRMIRAYLDILLLEAAKYVNRSHRSTPHANTHKLRKLERLIDENFRRMRQPSDYGEMMNVAPAYLNSICKQSLGKTLTDLIQSRLLLEAKRMFAYSDMNVNEVAAALNFTDTSYFTRWFKKQGGRTPEQFKNSL